MLQRTAYSAPIVKDHGTLVELTQDFDADFVGSVAKIVTLAAVSPPMGGETPGPNPGDDGDVGGRQDTGGTPTDGVDGVDGEDGGELGQRESGDGGGNGGGSGGGGGALPVGAGGGGGGGKLPFTGFPAVALAGVGAAMTTAGFVARQKLRRRGHQ